MLQVLLTVTYWTLELLQCGIFNEIIPLRVLNSFQVIDKEMLVHISAIIRSSLMFASEVGHEIAIKSGFFLVNTYNTRNGQSNLASNLGVQFIKRSNFCGKK